MSIGRLKLGSRPNSPNSQSGSQAATDSEDGHNKGKTYNKLHVDFMITILAYDRF